MASVYQYIPFAFCIKKYFFNVKSFLNVIQAPMEHCVFNFQRGRVLLLRGNSKMEFEDWKNILTAETGAFVPKSTIAPPISKVTSLVDGNVVIFYAHCTLLFKTNNFCIHKILANFMIGLDLGKVPLHKNN